MKFTIARNELLKGLQFISGVLERRQSMAVLSNVLIKIRDEELLLTSSNLEMELTAKVKPFSVLVSGEVTVSGRKLMDICRALPEESQIIFEVDNQKAIIQADKSRFLLGTLPVEDFPLAVIEEKGISFTLLQSHVVRLLESTHFAMADQDVRYYLNGLFLSLTKEEICAVATDGHRLALDTLLSTELCDDTQFILPRKAAMELLRVLNKENNTPIKLKCAANAIKFSSSDFVFVSRLIEGRFPDYHRVIPKNADKLALMDRDGLKQLLLRVSILTNEKYRAARLHFETGLLRVSANNTEQEEVQDELSITYEGNEVEIAFNVRYLLDVLNVLPEGNVKIHFSSAENSILVESEARSGALYVIMPMSL